MNIPKEQRIKAYKNAPDHIVDFCGSMELTSFIKNSIEKYSIENKDYFIDLVGDTILGFYDKKQMIKALSTLTNQSLEIKNELEELLSQHDIKIHQYQNDLSEAEENSSEHSITPLRTLEGDIQKVHGYGAMAEAAENEGITTHVSQQDDTLKKDRLAGLPSYNNLPDQP